ncbi:MAG: coproporphyrinogen III oxidase family protein [Alphaproteobacteria bacterium]|nr:coproporphyrinogen III oxidase family protein [Alphaproteobacteria bacterium]MCB9697895.1 coproporphyrinogen III oxidase family protein [Alphaproteobacteria bacterium]
MTSVPEHDVWGVYVHVPWCVAQCPYCAFAITPGAAAPDHRAWLDRLLWEHELRRPDFPGAPATVFFGGGTPSRLPPSAFAEALEAFRPVPGAEVSVEANPEDLDEAWVEGVLAAGVTRISIGVQTFDATVARRLGRARSAARAPEAVATVARLAPTFSVDLIFAVPGEPADRLRDDLRRVVDAGAPHLSVYGLTIEEGTRFERAVRGGRLVPVDDDRWREGYDTIVATARAAGLERYEVSNFARPGHASRHNRLYWTDAPYLGLGPSAHGYAPDGRRWSDHPDLATWLTADHPSAHEERPDPRARALDLLVSAMRCVEGLPLDRLGFALDPSVVDPLVRAGLVRRTGGRLQLTDAGFPVCDAVVARLADALTPQ